MNWKRVPQKDVENDKMIGFQLGTEIWQLTKAPKSKLAVTEMRMLRYMMKKAMRKKNYTIWVMAAVVLLTGRLMRNYIGVNM